MNNKKNVYEGINVSILEKNIIDYDKNKIVLIIRDPYNKIIDVRHVNYDKKKFNDISAFSEYVSKQFTNDSFLYCDYDIECKKKYLYENSKKRKSLDLDINFSNLKFEDYYKDTNSTLTINSVIFYGGIGGLGSQVFGIIAFLITIKDIIVSIINFIRLVFIWMFPFKNIKEKYGYGKIFMCDVINYSKEWEYGFMNFDKIKFKKITERSIMRKLGYKKSKNIWSKTFDYPKHQDILKKYIDC